MTTDLAERRAHASTLFFQLAPDITQAGIDRCLCDPLAYRACLEAYRIRRGELLSVNGLHETEGAALLGDIIAAMLALPRPPMPEGQLFVGVEPA